MVSNRSITLSLSDSTITRNISRGCPQGGVLSPFLWNLTLNDLLENHNLDPHFVQAFADDLAVIIGGIDIPTIRSKCQAYLNRINNWCTTIGVKLSTVKTKTIMFTRKHKWSLDKPLKIHGQTIPLEKTVKYLGVTLDNKLNWKSHIENSCKNALTQLHTAKSYCTKTWGIKPSYMKWIYTQIIIPALTHGSIVWSHLLTSNNSLRQLLSKVQRSALLLTTGAFNTTPTDYLEVLTNSLPLDLTVRLRSTHTSLRLIRTNTWITGYLDGKIPSHATILDKWTRTHLPPIHLHDTTLHTLNISLPFTYKLEEREQATTTAHHLHTQSNLVSYTDGSVKNTLAGAGFTIYTSPANHIDHSIHLGNGSTIFQAELFAIAALSEFILANPTIITPAIHICTDSQAALQALTATIIRSRTVLMTLNYLHNLSLHTSITLHWVPAHSGIPGNEIADTLANIGSDTPPIGPHPFLPYSDPTITDIIHRTFKAEHLRRLKTSRDSTDFHHKLILHIHKSFPTNFLSYSKSDIRALTHIVSGWNYLKYFQHKIGNENTNICDKCNLDTETTEHFLTSCIAHSIFRQQCFGKTPLHITDILTDSLIPSTIKFIRLTKYLDYFEPP